MKIKLENVLPDDIERRSFEIIGELMGDRQLEQLQEPIIKRVIHTTADFEYLDNLVFSPEAVEAGHRALQAGCSIVTDTEMARAGINKRLLAELGGEVLCFMADTEVAQLARENGTTRATASMEKAAALGGSMIFAIGNAPTALVRLCELIESGQISPALVIGVPVGFVNVVESKELLLQMRVPYIVARGRKGGSGVAAAIVNALLYQLSDGEIRFG